MPGRKSAGGTKDELSELVKLVLAYAKQETLDPIFSQAKALGKGLAGAVLLAIGTVLLAIGFLRSLQVEFGGAGRGLDVARTALVPGATPAGGLQARLVVGRAVGEPYGTGAHLSGDWSWVPYMGGALLCLLVVIFCVLRIMKGSRP
jgi:hypothetical protein